ncbi:hypothetical protein FACS1894116_01360 [Betaproteobacteria bacterium]|nr:hypothetical protein FACS1894116_01360 [Betaproteobacteria bacterium]
MGHLTDTKNLFGIICDFINSKRSADIRKVEKRSAFHHWTDQHKQQPPQRQTDVRAQAPCGG